MNRFAPYARPPHGLYPPRMPHHKSGGLLMIIPKAEPADPKPADNAIQYLSPVVIIEDPEPFDAEAHSKELCDIEEVEELTEQIRGWEKELYVPGVYRDCGYLGETLSISDRFMPREEHSKKMDDLATAADNASEHYKTLTGKYPMACPLYAEVVFGKDEPDIDSHVFDAACVFKKAVEDLDHLVEYFTPVDMDSFRQKLLELSALCSHARLRLRGIQNRGVEIGTAIFPH